MPTRLGNNRTLNWMSAAYYAGALLVGIVGFTPEHSTTLGGWAQALYSGGMIAFGAAGLVSVLAGGRRSEVVVLIGIGLITTINGTMLVGAGGPAQTGLRIITSALLTIPYGIYRAQAVLFRQDVRNHLRAAGEQHERP